MVRFSTVIKQFREQAEKTGWTYIEIPHNIAGKLKPGTKKSFRVKGKLDDYSFRGIALIPTGGGDFIMALNAEIRKNIGKRKGAKLNVVLEADDEFAIQPPADFLDCLSDEPAAINFFESLAKSHRDYFVKWIDSAKTDHTRIQRIAQSVSAPFKENGIWGDAQGTQERKG